jgi:hypothetical protein
METLETTETLNLNINLTLNLRVRVRGNGPVQRSESGKNPEKVSARRG